MKQIFAHRALMNSQEHSFEGISYFAELGLAMELDLRNSSAGIYLSHDHTGKGILFNGLSVIVGFSALLFSVFVPVQIFGILVMASISFCLFGALATLPALISLLNPKFLYR